MAVSTPSSRLTSWSSPSPTSNYASRHYSRHYSRRVSVGSYALRLTSFHNLIGPDAITPAFADNVQSPLGLCYFGAAEGVVCRLTVGYRQLTDGGGVGHYVTETEEGVAGLQAPMS